MSPTRRLLLLCVGAAAAIALTFVVLGRVLVGDPAGALVDAAPQDQPGPVLLVPGYGGSTSSLEVLATALRATGRTAEVVTLPGDATGDLRESAAALAAAVDRALAGGARSVDIVGYSAGGVVARLWVRDHRDQARRVVTLGSPHHGTKVAALGQVFVPGACPVACQQLVPDSDLLKDLNEGDETPDGPQWLALWTEQDETVTPPASARLDGAVNVALQQVCPGLQVGHSQLPRDATVTRIVEQALGPAGVVAPDRAVCVSS